MSLSIDEDKEIEETRCKRCNKPLRKKESIERGYGERCYQILLLQGIIQEDE